MKSSEEIFINVIWPRYLKFKFFGLAQLRAENNFGVYIELYIIIIYIHFEMTSLRRWRRRLTARNDGVENGFNGGKHVTATPGDTIIKHSCAYTYMYV